ncbi:MAG TPA: TetR/AcrR family transcriptional regulator [Usitatibacter sp.]|nr:TetR/AcrR family transcriptional regulator [Usitatibacter sp.]
MEIPPPRDRMIEAAITLMRRSGYSGVGINEVLAESGAPKGSMYHYFPGGKRQVAAESLATYAGRVVAFIDASLARGRTPAGKVRALFAAFEQRLLDSDYRQSCAAGCVSLDLDPELESVRAVVESAFADYIAVIASHFELGNATRARSFAGFVLTAIEGAYVRGRAERSGKAFREAGEWLARLVAVESRDA